MKTQLWKKYNQALHEAEEKCRTSNIVGEYAEDLVAKATGGKLADTSQKGFDVLSNCLRIQVKATRQNVEKGLRGNTSDIHNEDFDKLIGIIFSKEGEIIQVIEVSLDEAKTLWHQRKNGNNAWIISWGSLVKYAKENPSHDITNQYRNLVI